MDLILTAHFRRDSTVSEEDTNSIKATARLKSVYLRGNKKYGLRGVLRILIGS